MKKWKIGIVGAAGFAKGMHIPQYKKMDELELVACCDINAESLKKTCDEFAIPGRYTSLDEMLAKEQMDIVSVVTPPKAHIPLARKCVEAGRNVLVEKPLSEDYRELCAFRDFLTGRKEQVMVSQNYRWQNPAMEMKDVLRSGAIGQPYWMEAIQYVGIKAPHIGDGQAYKSHFINIGVHEVDLCRYFMDREVESVFAPRVTVPFAPEVKYSFTDIVVRFVGGAVATIRTDWTSRALDQWINLRIEGTEGVACCNYDASPDILVQRLNEPEKRFHRDESPNSIPRVIRHLIQCIEQGVRPSTAVEDNIKTMEIVLGAYLSCREGRVVRFPEDRRFLERV